MKENLHIPVSLLRGFERSVSVFEVVEGDYRKVFVDEMSFSNVVSLLWWVVASEFVFWDRGHRGDAEFVVNVLLEFAEPEWAENEARGAKFAEVGSFGDGRGFGELGGTALSVDFEAGTLGDWRAFSVVLGHCDKYCGNVVRSWQVVKMELGRRRLQLLFEVVV